MPLPPHNPRRACIVSVAAALALCASRGAPAQQLIGYVPTADANVTGASDVLDGHAVLTGSAAVTAKDHTAPISLARGGTVRVCQTSQLHLTESKSAPTASQVASPLLISLDRGAVEIQMPATINDSVMTPDLRFAVRIAGPLDLHVRVARNGDTCVENRGTQAPTLAVSDPFGESLYELLPNQHVLFEHGSLREVVDHEDTPCGCPEPTASIAEALLAPGKGPAASTPQKHPFPAAVSEGLAPEPAVPQAPPGQVHAQVTDVLTYNAPPSTPDQTTPTPAATPPPTPPPAPPPPQPHGLFHSVGHFFSHLFGRS